MKQNKDYAFMPRSISQQIGGSLLLSLHNHLKYNYFIHSLNSHFLR